MIDKTADLSLNGSLAVQPVSEFQPEHFINRELSWLEFNARVLEEAEDPATPLLECVKFLAIFSSNLDEFFMVRVAGLREQAFGDGAPEDYAADGLSPVAQLERIHARTQELVARQYRCWNEKVRPALAEQGIVILKHSDLNAEQRAELDAFFHERAFRILTPTAIDPSHPSPRFQNRGLYVAAMLQRQYGLGPKRMFAVVQLPQVLPRFVPLRSAHGFHFIPLIDAVQARLPELFGGFGVLASTTFRITRDSDFQLLEQESDDMLRLIEERLKARARGQAVRMEVSADAPEELIQTIVDSEDMRRPTRASTYNEVYRIAGPLDLTALMAFCRLPGLAHLRDAPYAPRVLAGRASRFGEDIFAAIREGDILLHHPYDAFAPVVEFVTRAATDPHVLAIKQTLYRTGPDSPITKALAQAAENGKHVTALVELQARFDEEFNVTWARQMERAGVHVVFGFMDMKTHCKMSMVVRQEGDSLRRYVHLSTGNYNPTTSAIYTDLGLFSVNEDLADDVTAVFNLLTGYSQGHRWNKLIVAPQDLHRRTIELIEQQAQRAREGKPAWIFGKLNALVDHKVVEALYRASQAGVPIDLVARGICCLRPGLPGISETIRVRSIVDRFLEHSRIYIFGPKDDCQVFLSSADWMPRNFYRRVELMFPVDTPALKDYLLNDVVPCYLRDNVKARILRADGTYYRAAPAPGEPPHRSQLELMNLFPRSPKPPQPPTSSGGDGETTYGLPVKRKRRSRA